VPSVRNQTISDRPLLGSPPQRCGAVVHPACRQQPAGGVCGGDLCWGLGDHSDAACGCVVARVGTAPACPVQHTASTWVHPFAARWCTRPTRPTTTARANGPALTLSCSRKSQQGPRAGCQQRTSSWTSLRCVCAQCPAQPAGGVGTWGHKGTTDHR